MSTKNRPEVMYSLNHHRFVKLGSRAVIHPVDHPVIPKHRTLHTSSPVISVEGIDFETMNTRYIGVWR